MTEPSASRAAPATELLPVPDRGRRFTATRSVRLSDVDPQSALRLDGVARYLQDVASDDADECGLDPTYGWVVRRTMIEMRSPAVLAEQLELTTFCTGSGRSWAERRTSITGAGGASIEAVSLWVQVDPGTGRPAPLGDDFHRIYGEAAAGRRVSTRLSLGAPSPVVAAELRPWSVRRADLDPFEHLNNAVHWTALEELVGQPDRSRVGRAETEFLLPVDLDTPVELHVAETNAWLVANGTVHTAFRWIPSTRSTPREPE